MTVEQGTPFDQSWRSGSTQSVDCADPNNATWSMWPAIASPPPTKGPEGLNFPIRLAPTTLSDESFVSTPANLQVASSFGNQFK